MTRMGCKCLEKTVARLSTFHYTCGSWDFKLNFSLAALGAVSFRVDEKVIFICEIAKNLHY